MLSSAHGLQKRVTTHSVSKLRGTEMRHAEASTPCDDAELRKGPKRGVMESMITRRVAPSCDNVGRADCEKQRAECDVPGIQAHNFRCRTYLLRQQYSLEYGIRSLDVECKRHVQPLEFGVDRLGRDLHYSNMY